MDEFNDFLERCENIGIDWDIVHKLAGLFFSHFMLGVSITDVLADGFLAGVMSKSK